MDEFRMGDELQELSGIISRAVSRIVEAKFVERIEILLGRVPSDEEVAAHGHRYIHPDKTVYKWDDTVLFEYRVIMDLFSPRVEFRTPK